MKIKPDKNCKWCRGSGIVSDCVDYGSTTTDLDSYCECVVIQTTEDDEEIELDID